MIASRTSRPVPRMDPPDGRPMTAKERKFWAFHQANPQVYRWIKKFSYEAVRAGYRHLSIAMVIERVRWETTVATRSEDGFKVSNDHKPFYARLFNYLHPQYHDEEEGGFFILHETVADRLADREF